MQWVHYETKLCADWHRVSVTHDISDEAMDWCEMAPGNSFTVLCGNVTRIDFYFNNVKDAVLFKLTWA